MKKFYLVILGSLCFINKSISQVSISSPVEPPAPSAMLDVKSTNKGVILPRVALLSATDVSTIASPATALIIYNTATAGTGTNAVTPGYYAWEGRWNRLTNYADAVYESKTNNTSLVSLNSGCTWNGPSLQSSILNRIIPDNNPLGATDTLHVTGNTGVVCNAQVDIRINHTYVGDLQIYLVAPDGTAVPLSLNNGGAGDNYGTGTDNSNFVYTIFSINGFSPITTGTAPFASWYLPQSTNFAALAGKPVNGKWVLKVVDAAGGDEGTIIKWNLSLFKQANINYVLEKEIPVTVKHGMTYLAMSNYTATCRDQAGIETHLSWSPVSGGPIGTEVSSLPANIQHTAAASPETNSSTRFVNLHNQALMNGGVAGNTIYIQLWRRGEIYSGNTNSSLIIQSIQQ